MAPAAPPRVVGHAFRERIRGKEGQALAEALFNPQRAAVVVRKRRGLFFEDVGQGYDHPLLYRYRHQPPHLIAPDLADVAADVRIVGQVGNHGRGAQRLGEVQYNLPMQASAFRTCVGGFHHHLPGELALDAEVPGLDVGDS